jgi:hypothetical protein
VEPDNSGRCGYSASPAGRQTFDAAARFFRAIAEARGDLTDPAVGPKLASVFARHGIEPVQVRPFPVSRVTLGRPADDVWRERRDAASQSMAQAPTDTVRALGREYLHALDAYEAEAAASGASFVEIQNTLLFATVGQRGD